MGICFKYMLKLIDFEISEKNYVVNSEEYKKKILKILSQVEKTKIRLELNKKSSFKIE